MTREEAISEWTFRSDHIKKWLDEYGEEPSIRHYVELIDMAIEALSAEQTLSNMPTPKEPTPIYDYMVGKTEPSDLISHEEAWKQIEGDIISRAEAIRAIQDGYCACVSDCIDEINKLPNMGTDCTDFINWIRRVVADEELWELNAVGYGEIICRKLVKIGALATTEKPPYYYVPSAELAELKQKFESADAIQGWIPCSERLPKAEDMYQPPEQRYLCQLEAYGVRKFCVLSRLKGEVSPFWDWYGVAFHDAEVIAWMPLPKPYKGGEDE